MQFIIGYDILIFSLCKKKLTNQKHNSEPTQWNDL
jgi:hypothetical protein